MVASLNGALLELIPLILGTGLAPVMVILVLTLLRGERGLLRAGAFLSGVVAVRLTQGLVFGMLLGSPDDSGEEIAARTITSTLLLVLGLLMLITAIRKFRKEEDPDEPPPKWMTMLASASPLKALGMGALAIAIGGKHWVFTLSALSVIREADLDQAGGVTLFLVYVTAASLPLLIPIVSLAISPQRASSILNGVGNWLDANNRAITIVVSAVFGAYFLTKGIRAFIG
jgi:putative Mn2+ efflux pump MntP